MKKGVLRYRVEIGLYFCFTIFFLLFLIVERAPDVFPEEAGYLGWANKLLYGQGSGLYFLPGYSILLMPLMKITNDITVIYSWLLAENAIINGFLVVGLYRLAGIWGLEGKKQILAAVAGALYAPFVLCVQKVICESLLIVCGIWLIVFLEGSFRGNIRQSIYAVLLGLMLMVTHSREFVLIPVVLLFLFICYRDKKAVWIGAGFVVLIGVLCGCFVILDSGVGAVHLKNQIRGLFSLNGLIQLILTIISQASYWIFSTFGLAPAGIWYGFKLVRQKQQGWQAALFALLFFAGTALLSALYMSHHAQSTHLIYGRYNDGAVAGVLILGILSFLKKRPPKWIWGTCVLDIAVTAALYRETLMDVPAENLNASGLIYFRLFMWRWDILAVFLVWAVIVLFLWSILKKKRMAAMVLLSLFFLFNVVYAETNFFKGENQPPKLVKILNQLEPEDQVLYTREDYVRNFYRCSVYSPALILSEKKAPLPYEGDIEISQQWLEGRVLLGAENGIFLWARDEETAQKYKHLQLPVNGDVTNPQSEITLLDCNDSDLKIQVKNTGSSWLCTDAVKDIQKSVRLGIRFFDKEGNMVEEQRRDFADNMLSGDVQEFSVLWNEQAETVSFELVQEFKNWFSELGDNGMLTVNRQGKTVDYPNADNGFHILYPQFLIEKTEQDALPTQANLQGFSGSHTTAKSSYCHIKINCKNKKELAIKTTEGDRYNPTVSVVLNDSVRLDTPVYHSGEYIYSLQGFEETIEKITLECEPYNPFTESGLPQWMSFLSLNSNLKPVQFAVHRMEDILGKSVNNHDYGIEVKQIEIR